MGTGDSSTSWRWSVVKGNEGKVRIVDYTHGPFFYDERTESVGCPAGWLLRIDHTSKGDGEFGNTDDDGRLVAQLLNEFYHLGGYP